MTIDEAIELIDTASAEIEWNYPLDYQIAFRMAEQALIDCKGRQIDFEKFVKYLNWEADLAKRDVDRAMRDHNLFHAAERQSDLNLWTYLLESITTGEEMDLPAYVKVNV